MTKEIHGKVDIVTVIAIAKATIIIGIKGIMTVAGTVIEIVIVSGNVRGAPRGLGVGVTGKGKDTIIRMITTAIENGTDVAAIVGTEGAMGETGAAVVTGNARTERTMSRGTGALRMVLIPVSIKINHRIIQ